MIIPTEPRARRTGTTKTTIDYSISADLAEVGLSPGSYVVEVYDNLTLGVRRQTDKTITRHYHLLRALPSTRGRVVADNFRVHGLALYYDGTCKGNLHVAVDFDRTATLGYDDGQIPSDTPPIDAKLGRARGVLVFSPSLDQAVWIDSTRLFDRTLTESGLNQSVDYAVTETSTKTR